MSYEEKGTWLFGAIAVFGYTTYLVLLVPQLFAAPVEEIGYQLPMIATIGGAIVVGILGGIVLGITSPKEAGVADVRDKQINRFGEQVGQSFIVIGALGALVLSLLELHWFWISNALYLGFVLSGILSVIAKLFAYRRGFHAW
jgi:hypothetical protein